MFGRFMSELKLTLRAMTPGYIAFFLVGIATLFGAVFGERLGLPRLVVGVLFTVLAAEAASLWLVIDLLRARRHHVS